jgi:hypothetical protein
VRVVPPYIGPRVARGEPSAGIQLAVKPKGNETGKRWEGNWGGKTGRLGSAACTEEGCELVVLGSSVAGIGGGSGCLRRKTTWIGPLQRVEPATNFA